MEQGPKSECPSRANGRDSAENKGACAHEGLDRALSLIQRLDERGELEAYVARNDALRPHIGQATILFASRE
jgi:hypothetical protein